jgi:hypothetical protein
MLSRLIARLTSPSRRADERAAAAAPPTAGSPPFVPAADDTFAVAQADWTPLPATATALPDWTRYLAPPSPPRQRPGGSRSLDAAALAHLMQRPEQRIDVAAFIAQQGITRQSITGAQVETPAPTMR